jgi:Ca2+/Na+ antiporter
MDARALVTSNSKNQLFNEGLADFKVQEVQKVFSKSLEQERLALKFSLKPLVFSSLVLLLIMTNDFLDVLEEEDKRRQAKIMVTVVVALSVFYFVWKSVSGFVR